MGLWKTIEDVFLDDFKLFATEGKAVDIALGTIIGAGVTPVANSIVDDIVMPPIGLILGKADLPNQFVVISEGQQGGPYKTLKEAQDDGAVTINYGKLINRAISLIVILTVAFGIVKGLNKLREAQKQAQLEKDKQQRQQALTQRMQTLQQQGPQNPDQIDDQQLYQKIKTAEQLQQLAQRAG